MLNIYSRSAKPTVNWKKKKKNGVDEKKKERKREELNLTRLKQACKTMALFLVCCWIRRQPFWTSKHYVSFFLGGAGGENLHEKRAKGPVNN